MQINSKIKKVREIKEFSQEYVASKLGITQATYSKLENNEKNLSIGKIKDIADIFLKLTLWNCLTLMKQ